MTLIPKARLLLVVGSLVAQHSILHAESLTYGVDMGVGETDNITLVPRDKISQTIAIADADFDLKETSRRFDVDAKGNFTYLDFLQGTYSHELIARFDGLGKFALIPERLSWTLQDSFGQAQVDPFAPLTPNNRENVNYLSTGPDGYLRLGSTAFTELSARYSRVEYATTPFDSNRFTGNFAVGVPLSARSTLSLDGSVERVLFDNTQLNVDFDRSNVYGHYTLEGARTRVKFDAGVTTVDQGGSSMSGPLIRVMLSRQLSAASMVTFNAGRDLTDTSTGFSGLQVGALGTIGTAPAATASTNYTVTYGSGAWAYVRDRTNINVSGRWERDAYAGQPQLDLSRDDVEVNVGRKLTSLLSAQLVGSYYRTQYENVDFAERDVMIGAAVICRPAKALEIRLKYDRVNRSVAGIGSGYTENRAFLTVGYRPITTPEQKSGRSLRPDS